MTVLFACVQNAGRSQIAAAWFNRLADATRARAISAGTRPAARIHPEVRETMREAGLAEALGMPQALTPELAARAQVLITMGCGDECPYVPGARVEDWPIRDPKGQPADVVRDIRDEIRARVEDLIRRLTPDF